MRWGAAPPKAVVAMAPEPPPPWADLLAARAAIAAMGCRFVIAARPVPFLGCPDLVWCAPAPRHAILGNARIGWRIETAAPLPPLGSNVFAVAGDADCSAYAGICWDPSGRAANPAAAFTLGESLSFLPQTAPGRIEAARDALYRLHAADRIAEPWADALGEMLDASAMVEDWSFRGRHTLAIRLDFRSLNGLSHAPRVPSAAGSQAERLLHGGAQPLGAAEHLRLVLPATLLGDAGGSDGELPAPGFELRLTGKGPPPRLERPDGGVVRGEDRGEEVLFHLPHRGLPGMDGGAEVFLRGPGWTVREATLLLPLPPRAFGRTEFPDLLSRYEGRVFADDPAGGAPPGATP